MKKYVTLTFFLILTMSITWVTSVAAEYESNMDEAVKVAEQFEAALFKKVADSRNFIDFIDIVSEDRHLIIYLKKRTPEPSRRAQDSFFKSVFDIWMNTLYVREKGYAPYFEVMGRADGVRIYREDGAYDDNGVILMPLDIGESKWPITTNFVRIYCKNLGFNAKAVYITTNVDGKLQDYAVNGTARGAMERLHLRDGLTLLREGLLPYELQPFIEIGLKQCS